MANYQVLRNDDVMSVPFRELQEGDQFVSYGEKEIMVRGWVATSMLLIEIYDTYTDTVYRRYVTEKGLPEVFDD